METPLIFVLLISLVGDVAVFLASMIFLTHKKLIKVLTTYATPFAAGALLAAAFVDFLHEGVELYEPQTVLIAALVGVVGFFVLEGTLHWFHHHSREPFEDNHLHDNETQPVAFLAAFGNWLHNFIDGAAIAAAFLVSPATGVVTTIAVAFHEIPREVADSGYLLQRGMSIKRVIQVHGFAIVVTAIGTTLFYLAGSKLEWIMPWLLGSTAGFFIYIAASDIIPSIRSGRKKKQGFDTETALVVFGATVITVVILVAHKFIG